MPAPSVAADVEWRECAALLRDDFASFAVWCFRELNPRAPLAMNWHVEVMAGKLAAVREGRIRRLMVCVPPGHLKSHLASILVSGLVPGPRPERPDRLRQLRPGPCRQIVARLPAHRHERISIAQPTIKKSARPLIWINSRNAISIILPIGTINITQPQIVPRSWSPGVPIAKAGIQWFQIVS